MEVDTLKNDVQHGNGFSVSSLEKSESSDNSLKEVVVIDLDGNERTVVVGKRNTDHELSDPSKCSTIYECDKCQYKTVWVRSLKRHVSAVHHNHKPLVCKCCEFRCSTKSVLLRHLITVHKIGENPFKCELCNYSTVEKSKLRRHMKVHDNERVYQCDVCHFKAKIKNNLIRHKRALHYNVKDHKCDDCGYTASEKYNLKFHMLSVHLQYRPYLCNLCKYCCSKKSSLKRHIEHVHKGTMLLTRAFTIVNQSEPLTNMTPTV